jgi:hypothetical protein
MEMEFKVAPKSYGPPDLSDKEFFIHGVSSQPAALTLTR